MTASELAEIGARLYGPHWQTKLAEVVGVDDSTVSRWARGVSAIPGPAALAIRQLDGGQDE